MARSTTRLPAGSRTLSAWRGGALPLGLTQRELKLVDDVLCLAPDLRVVVAIMREVRGRGIVYPIDSPEALAAPLGKACLNIGGHEISRRSIPRALSPRWFPVAHEGELLSVIHLGLLRCRAKAAEALDRRHSKSLGGDASRRPGRRGSVGKARAKP